jgi:hypothetical protein
MLIWIFLLAFETLKEHFLRYVFFCVDSFLSFMSFFIAVLDSLSGFRFVLDLLERRQALLGKIGFKNFYRYFPVLIPQKTLDNLIRFNSKRIF